MDDMLYNGLSEAPAPTENADNDNKDNKENKDIYIKERVFSQTEMVFAWLCVLFGYLFCLAFPPAKHPLGLLIIHTAALVSGVVVLKKRNANIDAFAVAAVIISYMFSFSVILTSNGTIAFISAVCAAISFCLFMFTASGARTEKGFSNFIVLDLFHLLFVYPFYNLTKLFKAMFLRKIKGIKNVLKFLLGLMIAVIPTALIVAYLSYDSEFLKIINAIFDVLRSINISRHIFSFGGGILVAMYFFSIYVSSTDEEKPTALSVEDVSHFSCKMRVAPIITVAASLLPVLAVYIIFFISQWQYYVSGFTGVLPVGVESYAEYARNGFFELCSVSIINFALMLAVTLFLKRNGNGGKAFLKAVSVIISVMTLVLIGTAMSKMYLYIDRFGLTEKRLLSSWFMVLLAIVFVLIIIRQFVPKFKIISASAVALCAMLLILTASNHTRIIAEHNVDMFINGKTKTIDVNALDGLDSSSSPALVRLAEFWDEGSLNQAQQSEKELRYEHLVNMLDAKKKSLEAKKSFTRFSFPDYYALNALNDYFK